VYLTKLGAILGGASLFGLLVLPRPAPVVHPLKLSDLTMNRSVRQVVTLPAPTPDPNTGNPVYAFSEQMPANMGIAITELAGVPHHSTSAAVRLHIEVAGTLRASVLITSANVANPSHSFDPPLVVRPGETVTFTFLPHAPLVPGGDSLELSIGGWKLEPGDA
jgi:hypothetical protein